MNKQGIPSIPERSQFARLEGRTNRATEKLARTEKSSSVIGRVCDMNIDWLIARLTYGKLSYGYGLGLFN